MQPWATLVAMGIKTIETRTWATDYRGPLFIHASKSRAGRSVLPLLPAATLIKDFNGLAFGAIIGEVMLTDVLRYGNLNLPDDQWERRAQEGKAFGDYTTKFCWLLTEAAFFDDPIAATGRLGLWEF